MLGGGFSEEALAWLENLDWAERYAGIDFRPPQAVADAAARGLELRKKHKRGGLSPQEAGKAGIGSGVTRATSLKNRQQLSPETIGRMVSYFARHEVDLRSEAARKSTEPTAGEIAWLLWGGNPGRSWAESVKRQMERAEEKGKADHSEYAGSDDFAQACQRPDGSVYGTTGQCRKGTPITLDPGEGMPVLYKKAVAAGLKGPEVKAIADRVREKFGVKQIKKGPELEAVLTEVKKRLGENVEVASFPAPKVASVKPTLTPTPTSTRAPKPQSEKPAPAAAPTPKESIKSESPASAKTSKISDERVKATFDRAVANEMKLIEKQKELQAQGKKWDDPEYRALSAKVGKAHEAVELMRQAYHAVDRDAFLKAAGEQKKLRDEAEKLESKARALLEKDGFNTFNAPDSHPSKALFNKALEIRFDAHLAPAERMAAAFYGEPAKLSKPPSDGGGAVHASIPSRVPRGGADKDLKDFLESSQLVMAFNPKGFAKFVKEGEAKNGFEAGTGGVKRGKSGYLDGRRSGEEKVMGISKATDAKGRPVYAALEHPDRARSLQGGSGNQMAQYGGVQVLFKNDTKDRATFTIGDSLDTSAPLRVMASPVRDPASPVSSTTAMRDVKYGDPPRSQSITYHISHDGRPYSVSYVEAQVHGGLRTSDISEVRYYKGHDIPPATRKALEKQGVRIVELPPQMSDLKVEREHPGYSDIQTVQQFWK